MCELTIPGALFKDKESEPWIGEIPALDVIGYGDTVEECLTSVRLSVEGLSELPKHEHLEVHQVANNRFDLIAKLSQIKRLVAQNNPELLERLSKASDRCDEVNRGKPKEKIVLRLTPDPSYPQFAAASHG